MRTLTLRHSGRAVRMALAMFSLHCAASGQSPDPLATRGQVPTGSYSFSDLETVDNVSGNLSYRIPLASLGPGRAGFNWGLSLVYNSNIFDVVPESGYSQVSPGDSTTVNRLTQSQSGGWRYAIGFGLQLEECFASGQGNDYGSCPDQAGHVDKLNLLFPDGSHHTLFLQGQPTDPLGLGIRDLGTLWCYDIRE